METSTHKLEKVGQYIGWRYRGAKIAKRGTSKGRTSKTIRPYYEIDITSIATDKYKKDFFSTVTKFTFIADTLKEATTTIDEMFDNAELA